MNGFQQITREQNIKGHYISIHQDINMYVWYLENIDVQFKNSHLCKRRPTNVVFQHFQTLQFDNFSNVILSDILTALPSLEQKFSP